MFRVLRSTKSRSSLACALNYNNYAIVICQKRRASAALSRIPWRIFVVHRRLNIQNLVGCSRSWNCTKCSSVAIWKDRVRERISPVLPFGRNLLRFINESVRRYLCASASRRGERREKDGVNFPRTWTGENRIFLWTVFSLFLSPSLVSRNEKIYRRPSSSRLVEIYFNSRSSHPSFRPVKQNLRCKERFKGRSDGRKLARKHATPARNEFTTANRRKTLV